MVAFAILGTLNLVTGLAGVPYLLFFGKTTGIRLSGIVPLALVWAFWRVVKGPTQTFYRIAFGRQYISRQYINCVEVCTGCIHFGVGEPNLALPVVSDTRIFTSGIFGTHVIRFFATGCSIVIPKAAISRELFQDALGKPGAGKG